MKKTYIILLTLIMMMSTSILYAQSDNDSNNAGDDNLQSLDITPVFAYYNYCYNGLYSNYFGLCLDIVFNHTIIELENITLYTGVGLYAGYMHLGFGHEITDYLIPIQGVASAELSIKDKIGFHITGRTGLLIHGVYDWYSMITYSLSVGGGIRIYITPNIVFIYTLLYNMTAPNGYVVDIIDEEVGVLFRFAF